MTKKCNRLRGERPKAFWGALVGGAMNLIGSAISSKSQARAIRRQIEAQKEAAQTQLELANNSNLASTLNSYAAATRSYNNEDDYNLRYRLGGNKRLGSNRIYITDGGDATKIENDTFLLRGGSHEQTNETGQTGIGINVGGNEVEAEGGEVAQKKNGALRIFSAQPILNNGMSPAQAVMSGANKDKVFSAQQSFKKRNGLEDDGGKAQWGDFFPLFGKRKPVKSTDRYSRQGDFIYDNKTKKRTISQLPLGLTYPEYVLLSGGRQMEFNRLKEAAQPIRKAITGKGFNLSKEYPDLTSGVIEYLKQFNGLVNPIMRYGGLTSKDRGSSKHPYPSVSSKDFAGGGRSYPIPTKADAVDALRLAGLHGRSDVKAKVYSRYPELRPKARNGGGWTAPVYNTKKYRVSNRMRKQIATWEGSDFAGQNRKFKGDAIGAKERELRQLMGRTYNYLNDNQRDSLNSIYYNSRVDTFKNNFSKWFRNLNDAVDRGDERAFNNSLAGIRQNMTTGANRKGMSGLAKRRAWEQDWFGNPIPMDSNETKAILKQQADARMIQPTDNTRVVIQPQYIEVPAPIGHGIVPVDNPDPNLLQGNVKDNLINMGSKFRLGQRCGGSTRMRKSLGGYSRPVKGMRSKFLIGGKEDEGYDMTGELSPVITTANWRTPRFATVDTNARAIPNFGTIKVPTYVPSSTVPYIGQDYNRSRTIFTGGDYLGLGIDSLTALGTGLITSNAYKNLDFNYNLPNFVEESPVALNTTYHNEAQKSNVERNRLNSRNNILRNTMSGSTAVGRMQGVDTNALYQLNQLADEKTNKETELMNQNLLNEQQVRARNAAAKNQYYNTVASIKNAALEAKNNASLARSQAFSTSLSGLSQAWNNFWTAGRTAYEDDQARRAMIASSKDATPTRLIEMGYNLSPQVIASLYNTSTDQRTKNFYLSMLDEKQRRKYGIS